MKEEQILLFGSFCLDLVNSSLRRGKRALFLTPKAFTLLRYLAEHAGRLVTKDELWQAVWSGTTVTDAALTVCMSEIRKALGDSAQTPQYVETVHRRGYRFIAPITTAAQPVQSSQFKVQRSKTEPAPSIQHPAPTLVGREAELEQLHRWLEKALDGERQIIFVTGEPGIGKTALVETFVAQAASNGAVRLGRGQCIEHYGAGEAYLPLLEALGRLCRAPGGKSLINLLAQHAPTWLVQMPPLVHAAELEELHRKVAGVTKERMLRELAEALEALTLDRPLVLWLEDLHWGDYSTLDWLAFVARRQEPARLLVIGTYRPVEVLVHEHPLKAVKQELRLHGHCQELALDFLREEEVMEYLVRRFAVGATGRSPLQGVARFIHRRTDGNPLFMVNMVDHLLSQGVLMQLARQWTLKGEEAAAAVPESLRQMIQQRLERVNPVERSVLEVASVAGVEFSAATVAAGAETTREAVEEQCAELARRESFLQVCGTAEWPDGTVATRYGFLHALYQEVLYERLPAGRRQRLHHRIGEREEAAYGERAREIAAELAVHFERGRDYRKAVQYLQYAGENAVRRSANQEAIHLLTKGLELLKTLPDTSERAQQELPLLTALGPAFISMKGYGAPEVEHTYARAYELCQQGGRPLELIGVLAGLKAFYLVRGEVHKARGLAEQCLRLAQSVSTPSALMAAHALLMEPLFLLGEVTAAREHFEQAWALYNPQEHNINFIQAWVDPGVALLSNIALTLWSLGYPDQAQQRCHEFLALAGELSHPFSLGFALLRACSFHFFHQEWQRARERAEEVMRLSTEQGFPFWLADGTALRGWALIMQGQVEEGIAQMEQGLVFFHATGTEVERLGHLLRLAAAYGRVGRVEEGLAVLAEALAVVDKTGVRVFEAGLYVTKGWLLLARSGDNQAEGEACFRQAIDIARRQSAKSLELRAVMSLSRLWQQQGKKEEARQMLAEIYGWFTEGFDTADLQEAKALLAELGG